MTRTEYNGLQDERLAKIEGHIETLNHNSSKTQADIVWLKWFIKIIMGVILANGAGTLYLILK